MFLLAKQSNQITYNIYKNYKLNINEHLLSILRHLNTRSRVLWKLQSHWTPSGKCITKCVTRKYQEISSLVEINQVKTTASLVIILGRQDF